MEANKDSQLKGKDRTWPLVIFIGAVIILATIYAISIYLSFGSWQNSGLFGDSFGAVNSLFSGLAFAGIIYTVLLQRRELALQREELSLTRNELKRTADAQEKSEEALTKQIESLNDTAKLNALQTIVDHYTKLSEKHRRDNNLLNKYGNKVINAIKEIEFIVEKIRNED